MAVSPADRKRQQRERVAQGAVSSDVIKKELLRILRAKVVLWCRDQDQTPATVIDLVNEVSYLFPDEEHFRVQSYLGVLPDDEAALM